MTRPPHNTSAHVPDRDGVSARAPRALARVAFAASALAALLGLLLHAAPARAQLGDAPVVEPSETTRHRVAVLPRTSFYPHLDASRASGDDEHLDLRAVQATLGEHFRHQPYFTLMSRLEVYERLQTSEIRARLLLADDRRQSGIQLFFGLDYPQAASTLREALELYPPVFGELLAPDRLGEVHQFLAFSLLEQQALAGPSGVPASKSVEIAGHIRAFIRLAPEQLLDSARHPPDWVELYAETRRDFLANRALRDERIEDARRVADTLDVDFLVYSRVVQDAGGAYALELQIYDHTTDAFRYEASTPLPTEPGAAAERTDAILSRFTSCVTAKPPPEDPDLHDADHIYLDIGPAYYQFLDSPTTSPFDNIGATFAGTYMLTDYVGALVRMTLIFSGNNRQGDLLTTFTTFRGVIGASASYKFRWFRPYFQAGLELAKATPFDATRDIDCKAFGVDDPACTQVNSFDIALLMGLNIAAGLNIGYNPLFLTLQTSFAYYFFPFSEGKEINLPVGFTAAFGYRF